MTSLQLDTYERVLVVTAHPDDVDFIAGGTVARLVDGGADVAYLIVTDGQAGGFDEALDRADMPAMRRAEQVAAAAALGVENVSFLGLVDGEVVADLALAKDISRAIRRHRPDLVIGMSPERNYLRVGASHPDHRAVGSSTIDAVYPFARNPFAFPELLADEGLAAHIAPELWLMADPSSDLFVDVTDTFDRKFLAVVAHVSQLPDPAGLDERLRSWLGDTARQGGLPDGRLAESFRRVRIG